MKNKCVVCGKAFESPRKKPYCSEKCRYKDNYKKKKIDHLCLLCGNTFVSPHNNTQFCSIACRAKYNRREKTDVKYCKLCGKELGKLVKGRVFCSKECLQLWQKENPRRVKICPVCRKEFRTNDKKQKYCSKDCAASVRKRTKVFVCKNCSKKFIPKVNDRITFCGRECSIEWRKKNRKPRIKEQRIYKLICAECGKEFESIYKSALYCTYKCREEKAKKKYKKLQRLISKICKDCGKSFVTYKKSQLFCSNYCCRRYHNNLRHIRRQNIIIANGNADYSITLKKLYLRDKGICKICMDRVNMKADTNSNQYGSIDHIIPISLGGKHEWNNVQLAHRGCNSKKANKLIVNI